MINQGKKIRLIVSISLVSLLILLIGTTVSCTFFSPIVGKWQDQNSNIIEFTRDGKVVINSGGFIVSGEYELISDNIVKLKLGGLAGDIASFVGDTWQYEISENTMVVTASGSKTIYTRVGSTVSSPITSNVKTTKLPSSSSASVSTTTVTFPDPNLESAVRLKINKPSGQIYKNDLLVLTDLFAEKRNISNLAGLEYCTNLTSLTLDNNNISSLSPLAPLVNLEELDLTNNKISDISSLRSLINLTRISFYNNQISDISPLVSLVNLNDLDLTYNQVSDISPLLNNEGLSNGDYISFFRNPLNARSINTYIPQLKSRGVKVVY